jgi:hypothetical protein
VREIRLHCSEGGGTELNLSSLPLSRLSGQAGFSNLAPRIARETDQVMQVRTIDGLRFSPASKIRKSRLTGDGADTKLACFRLDQRTGRGPLSLPSKIAVWPLPAAGGGRTLKCLRLALPTLSGPFHK